MEIGGRVKLNDMRHSRGDDLFVESFSKEMGNSGLSDLERNTNSPVHFHLHLRYNGRMPQRIGSMIEQVLV